MRTARLLPLLVALLALCVTAGTARSDVAAPTGLHGFLLRADEPQMTSFSRTPSFAWNPVPGALHYEFQLSLDTTFSDNSVLWADPNALTPVEAPPITLPWITGSPYALYARVRAITTDGATPWSANFGFDMVPGPAPTPLASYPGLLRWSPVEGASGYEVWLIDAHKQEFVSTNSLDEREFYTFHQTSSWIGTVRWRIRALRATAASSGEEPLINGIPAVSYGPWSSIYTSTNPPFNTPVANGVPSSCPPATPSCIRLVGTVSDVFSNGSAGSPAHKLMPGFLWTGNTAIDGTNVELYRVYVFTDKQCLNRVYTSAVIGSPAYSPRPGGPLALPATAAGVAAARSTYLSDGPEPASFSYDGDSVTSSESASAATPTSSAPAEPGDTTTPSSTGTPSDSSSTPSSSSSAPTTGSASSSTTGGTTGAPVDLWDTNWPESGYYWTVVGVAAESPGSISTAVGPAGAKSGDLSIPVTNATGFNPGDTVTIGTGATQDVGTITAVNGGTLTLALALKFGHGFGEPVVRVSGGFQYQDVELPQDVCAAGRVMRFGKESEPSLVASGQLFASGLSSDGRLTSGAHTTAFYGQPLVSWTPALGAGTYEVQWSKTQYPFVAETAATGQPGIMTGTTSVVLPVGPGTWWYRVRGFDFNLPTGAQQMSWSTPVKLVVAAPKFKVIGGSTSSTPTGASAVKTSVKLAAGLHSAAGDGFAMGVPTGWTKVSIPDSIIMFAYRNPATRANVNILRSSGRAGASLSAWRSRLAAEVRAAAGVSPSTTLVTLPAGHAVKLVFTHAVSGVRMTQVQYVVDAGASAYDITFTTTAARYAKDAPTFAKMIASFALTS